jgi:acyl-CoA synthetase (AMP-forming)/AMP-acid ligase II
MVGRKKEVIKSGGETVVPNEIEGVRREVEGIKEACVVGVADRDWGERVHAVIADGVPIAPSCSLLPRRIAAHVCRVTSAKNLDRGRCSADKTGR